MVMMAMMLMMAVTMTMMIYDDKDYDNSAYSS